MGKKDFKWVKTRSDKKSVKPMDAFRTNFWIKIKATSFVNTCTCKKGNVINQSYDNNILVKNEIDVIFVCKLYSQIIVI